MQTMPSTRSPRPSRFVSSVEYIGGWQESLGPDWKGQEISILAWALGCLDYHDRLALMDFVFPPVFTYLSTRLHTLIIKWSAAEDPKSPVSMLPSGPHVPCASLCSARPQASAQCPGSILVSEVKSRLHEASRMVPIMLADAVHTLARIHLRSLVQTLYPHTLKMWKEQI